MGVCVSWVRLGCLYLSVCVKVCVYIETCYLKDRFVWSKDGLTMQLVANSYHEVCLFASEQHFCS